ncbi:MAG: PilC/PilY family type IV pilus protein [Aquisalimonadaceae bacterium]
MPDRQTTRIVQIGAALSFAAGYAVIVAADDTDIFVGQTDGSIRPNVMFIVDTSGSMAASEEIVRNPYDPSKTYAGDCPDGRIYWGGNNDSVPSCSGQRWIDTSANACDAIVQTLVSNGRTIATRAAQLRRVNFWFFSRWRWTGLQSGDHDSWVECAEDGGVHGEDALSNGKYAEDNNASGWSTSANDEISWSSQGQYAFYSPNYVNWYENESDALAMTRLEIVQDIAKDIINSVSGINIGLTRFDNDQWLPLNGGFVDLEIDNVTSNRAEFGQLIDSYDARGGTPLSDVLYEAYLYFAGRDVYFGDSTNPRRSTSGSRNGWTYESPIEEACQYNHVVFLTDGTPEGDGRAENRIEDLLGRNCSGNCLDDLAGYMNKNDVNWDVDGDNVVITHTVGFKTNQTLLADAAEEGGGGYYTADNYAELQAALTEIFSGILATNSLFTAPAVSVNAFNRLTHLDQVYFALFRPAEGPRWNGNIKRYRFDAASGELVDANGADAVNPATGLFADNARSYWSPEVDGNDVLKGGAAGMLASRSNVYTYTGDTAPGDVLLTALEHALHESNDELTGALLGDAGMPADDREALLKWARGIDVWQGAGGQPRLELGDPLHTKPVIVGYGASATAPELTLFVTTNEGYFHAIDTESGEEIFAFMPQELLPNLMALYENSSTEDKVYGLDGPLTVWTNDDGKNGIEPGEGESVYAYFGMRRGGSNYYALDVTHRNAPKLMWMIEGGTGAFAELGQTWSRPIHTRIRLNDVNRDVLIFGGGYDPAQDAAEQAESTRAADATGRGLFIVDAETGALVWSGGPTPSGHDETFSSMEYSIPSDPRVIDINNDGLADQIHVGDTGGQLWRFDIDNSAQMASKLVTGTVIADLNDGTATGNRRFYHAPDVAIMKDYDGKLVFSISIGSGWRADPLDEDVEDRLYMIKSPYVFGPPRNPGGIVTYPATLTESDLFDATDNAIGAGDTDALATLQSRDGWYIRLVDNSGEKALAESVTVNNQILFTTYQPNPNTAVGVCGPSEGVGRAYALSMRDATAAVDLDGSGTLTRVDRSTVIKRTGIPPGVVILFPGGEPKALVGPEQPLKALPFGEPIERTFWRDEQN